MLEHVPISRREWILLAGVVASVALVLTIAVGVVLGPPVVVDRPPAEPGCPDPASDLDERIRRAARPIIDAMAREAVGRAIREGRLVVPHR